MLNETNNISQDGGLKNINIFMEGGGGRGVEFVERLRLGNGRERGDVKQNVDGKGEIID